MFSQQVFVSLVLNLMAFLLLGPLSVIYMIPDDFGLFICLQSMDLFSHTIQFSWFLMTTPCRYACPCHAFCSSHS